MATFYDNEFEEMTIDCDGCSDSIDLEGRWGECIQEAKDEGWLIIKSGEEWKHFCPECKNS